jgi:putative glutamine amidotransferase
VSRAADVAIVAYHLRPGRVSLWQVGGYGVPESYVDAVRRAGACVTLLLPGEDRSPADLLERSDALMLVGGGDVEPWRYGADPHGTVYGLEPDRDSFEIDLLLEADRKGVPTLCICRGMQVMNVAFGGTLIANLPDDGRFQRHGAPSGVDRLVHEVELETGSRVAVAAGGPVLACSSHHHQGVDRVGHGLSVTGRSRDGLVEAIERDGDAWMVGVQWHPEDTAAEDAAQQGLFTSLVERARAG